MTTLRSLQHYASRQTELIESLVDPRFPNYHFRDFNDKLYWVQLWKSAWDKDPDSFDKVENVERGSDTIDDSLIFPDVVPPSRNVMHLPEVTKNCWDFKPGCNKIFIRSEYKAAEEFILSTCGTTCDALLVTGQPGIGNSVFLLRILLRRLALKLPTALQVKPDRAMLFYEKGVKEFAKLDDAPAYHQLFSADQPLARIWALVDCSWHLHEPAWVFQDGPFFVLEATSRPMHWLWTRRLKTEFFYMKQWPFAEVLQARSLISSAESEKKLWHLHYQYGASLRSLFQFADNPIRYDDFVNIELGKLDRKGLIELHKAPINLTETSHYVVSIGPLPTDRTRAERKVVSTYVLERIFEQVLEGQVEEMRNLYQALGNDPTTTTAARMIFVSRVHQYLKKHRVIELFPIHCDPSVGEKVFVYKHYSNTGSTELMLPKSKELVFSNDPDTNLEIDTYYRPRNTNFSATDSWLLTQDPSMFLMFRITSKEELDLKMNGLDRVDKLAGANTKKCLVVVTPEGMQPEITVSKEYLTETFLAHREPDVAFPVYRLQISDYMLFDRFF